VDPVPSRAPAQTPRSATGSRSAAALLRAHDGSPLPAAPADRSLTSPPRTPGAPAASPGTALARSPANGADRPRLQLVPTEAETETDAADHDTEVPVPESPFSKAQAIARATSGAITYEDDGRMSVLFPPPGALTAAPAATLAREGAEADGAPAPTAVTASAPAAAAPTGAAAPPAGAALDRDELYQDFMRRLRRDVLEQREQLGELF
jgi:hypothetical protein